ncbi:Hsp20/alpha crystallin family protein [Paraburkholderia sp. SARCC-3016]|uniref:Hsp20/alpha crystallin family protein n=1 Tax=Paraburkholderia sp. SARCC-3016 TaxID=3058611 RepID=UPI00280820ED|nr:Hsp20/alpha crystallin family protein [Paraburkholderia sp. SARCC-3016]MDQ7979463.1 Hsp20/alpha crystallin family protein [Paraburkholderia sp. SARCC-3016]
MSDTNLIAPGQGAEQAAGRDAAVTGAAASGREDKEARRTTITPAVDIVEDNRAVTLWADLPGVSKDRLDIRVHDGNLVIEAESSVPTPANLRLTHAEVRAPYFARRFTVSDDFDTSKIEANLKDGVLKLTIPRRDEAKPRRIEVSVG